MNKKGDVTIFYGPYLSCGTVDYRLDRLQGLITLLKKENYEITLEKTLERNLVQLIVHDEVVYTCKIQELVFGGDGKLDKKCYEAVDCISRCFL
uniref:UPF0728 protein C10orf53 n=1 Tax=Hydra vulgaris TaxID=6087 RepID=T2M9K0_HYDVU